MRFARGDMRDHIVSHKNDHGASCWRYGILRFRSRLKINICETFGVVRFSTFATILALVGTAAMSGVRSLSGGKRTCRGKPISVAFDPTRTLQSLVWSNYLFRPRLH